MMADAALHSDAPAEAPPRRRTQTLVVLLTLSLWALFYFGLMMFCVSYTLSALWFAHSIELNDGWAYWLIASLAPIAPALFVLTWLTQNLFTGRRIQQEAPIEINADEQPRLFEFLLQVCAETGIDLPHRVMLDYTANAAAQLESASCWDLVRPGRRRLVIGLALVNECNVSEFKALLAHELAHFGQPGMALGGAVFRALRIGEQAVAAASPLDRRLIAWSQGTPVLAWPARLALAVLWPLRRLFAWSLVVLYRQQLALQREMEFDADLVAVRVAGSAAQARLLDRCADADARLEQTIRDLRRALTHGIFTRDLFCHLSACERNPGKTPRHDVWSTHPSRRERESNLEDIEVCAEIDERPAWELFDDAETLRRRATEQFYRLAFPQHEIDLPSEPAVVQSFLDVRA
jgi:Zn-dependent protease with chaperone function